MKKGWNADDNVRRDRRWLKRLGTVKTWQLLILLVIFMMLAAIFLRLNNLGMIERRDAVIAADKAGDVAKVQKTAAELQNFVSRHMNTYMGHGIALQNTYDAAVQRAVETSKVPDLNSEAFRVASENCKPKIAQGGYSAYSSCIVAAIGGQGTESLGNPKLPNASAFYLIFSPPIWSLDLAGIMLLICLVILIAILVRLIAIVVLKLILRFKYRSV